MTFISTGDFVDSWNFLNQKGLYPLLKKFQPFAEDRVIETWKCIDRNASDWWIIPKLRQRWNRMISGDPLTLFQDHLLNNYLLGKKNLKILSVGSGGGTAEILFGQRERIEEVVGIDLSPRIVSYANLKARKAGLDHVQFYCANALKYCSDTKFDILLFNSSLHHFGNIGSVLDKFKTFLKAEGLLVFNEYTGPDRFQWTPDQLKTANELLLMKVPQSYRKLYKVGGYKNKCYRPGVLRSIISDPSESSNSSKLITEIENRFKKLQLTNLGGNILHLLLKDISHHFTGDDEQTKCLLKQLFRAEDQFLSTVAGSDFSFGIYQNTEAR